jgi:hypothetical protein
VRQRGGEGARGRWQRGGCGQARLVSNRGPPAVLRRRGVPWRRRPAPLGRAAGSAARAGPPLAARLVWLGLKVVVLGVVLPAELLEGLVLVGGHPGDGVVGNLLLTAAESSVGAYLGLEGRLPHARLGHGHRRSRRCRWRHFIFILRKV